MQSNIKNNKVKVNRKFTKKDIGTKFVFTPNENNTITAEYSNTQQEREHNPGLSLLPTASRTYSKLDKNNYSLTHEGKYDKLVVNSYLQYDKDKNTSITGRTISSNARTATSRHRGTARSSLEATRERSADASTSRLPAPARTSA